MAKAPLQKDWCWNVSDETEPANEEARAADPRSSFKIPKKWRLFMKTFARKPPGGQPLGGSALEWAKALVPLIVELLRHIK